MAILPQITELLGWAAIINIGFLVIETAILTLTKSAPITLHSKLFGIPEKDLPLIYFKYLASYKTLTLVFIISPYIALKIMGN